MKKKRMLIVVIIFTMLLCACNNSKYTTDIATNSSNSNTKGKFSNFTFDPQAVQYYMQRGSAAAEDGYYYISYSPVQEGQEKFFYYFDMNSMTAVPLCSKLDCEHNSANCDAYISEDRCVGNNFWYYNQRLYMIEKTSEKDILVSYDKDGRDKRTVATLSVDNASVGVKGNVDHAACVVAGYLYYYANNIKNISNGYTEAILYRIVLDGKGKPEKLASYQINIDVGGALGLFAIENNVYLTFTQGVTSTKANYILDRYNIQTEKMEQMLQFDTDNTSSFCRGKISSWINDIFFDNENNMYFVSFISDDTQNRQENEIANSKNGTAILNKISLKTMETKELYVLEGTIEKPINLASLMIGGFDGTYIYLYKVQSVKNTDESGNSFYVINTDGSVVDQIPLTLNKDFQSQYKLGGSSSIGIIFVGGDQRYLMITTGAVAVTGIEQTDKWMKKIQEAKNNKKQAYSRVVAVYDKSQIGTGQNVWTRVSP